MHVIFGSLQYFLLLLCISVASSGGIHCSFPPPAGLEEWPRVVLNRRIPASFVQPFAAQALDKILKRSSVPQHICSLLEGSDSLQRNSRSCQGTRGLGHAHADLYRNTPSNGLRLPAYDARHPRTSMQASTISGTFTVSARVVEQFFAPHLFLKRKKATDELLASISSCTIFWTYQQTMFTILVSSRNTCMASLQAFTFF
jgi:hypothetical protein